MDVVGKVVITKFSIGQKNTGYYYFFLPRISQFQFISAYLHYLLTTLRSMSWLQNVSNLTNLWLNLRSKSVPFYLTREWKFKSNHPRPLGGKNVDLLRCDSSFGKISKCSELCRSSVQTIAQRYKHQGIFSCQIANGRIQIISFILLLSSTLLHLGRSRWEEVEKCENDLFFFSLLFFFI